MSSYEEYCDELERRISEIEDDCPVDGDSVRRKMRVSAAINRLEDEEHWCIECNAAVRLSWAHDFDRDVYVVTATCPRCGHSVTQDFPEDNLDDAEVLRRIEECRDE